MISRSSSDDDNDEDGSDDKGILKSDSSESDYEDQDRKSDILSPASAAQANQCNWQQHPTQQAESSFDLDDNLLQVDDNYDYIDWIKKEQLFFEHRYHKAYEIPAIVETFKAVGLVARARFGDVCLALSEQKGSIHAMKIMNKERVIRSGDARYVINERKMLSAVQHPMVVSLIDRKITNSNLYVICKLCEYGKLTDIMQLQPNKKFTIECARFYFGQIILVLEYMHSMRVIFRDLQPNNLALGFDGYLYFIELGLAKLMPPGFNRTYTIIGSMEYSAPEIFSSENCGYTFFADWWSAGCCLFEMLTGHPPFVVKAASPIDTLSEIANGKVDFPTDFDTDAENLVEMLCSKLPANRVEYQSSGLTNLPDHPFYKDFNFIRLFNKAITPPFDPTMNESRAFSVYKLPTQTVEAVESTEILFQDEFEEF